MWGPPEANVAGTFVSTSFLGVGEKTSGKADVVVPTLKLFHEKLNC